MIKKNIDVTGLERLSSNGVNKDIYVDGDYIYKFIENPKFDFEYCMKYLKCSIKNKRINLPIDLLTCNDKIGYSQKYLRDMITLRESIHDTNISTNDRLFILKKILEVINYLHKNNIAHGDLHMGQILLNKRKVHFIDVDSFYPMDIYSSLFDVKKKLDNHYLMTMIISYLYEYDLEVADNFFVSSIVDRLTLDECVKDYIKFYVNNHTFSDIDVSILNDFMIDKVNYDVKRIKNKLLLK